MKRAVTLLAMTLVAAAAAGEPNVVEQQRGDGLTELRIESGAGHVIATYPLDLNRHHQPATNDTGAVRRWESYRYGGFVCFNDNQFSGEEFSKNKDASLYDPSTRWGGPVGSRAGWLEVNLGEETIVSRAVIQEGWDRTRTFSVQYKVGDEWKDAAAGTTIGANRELRFAPVKAEVFRLNIADATDVPTIWEFQLFKN